MLENLERLGIWLGVITGTGTILIWMFSVLPLKSQHSIRGAVQRFSIAVGMTFIERGLKPVSPLWHHNVSRLMDQVFGTGWQARRTVVGVVLSFYLSVLIVQFALITYALLAGVFEFPIFVAKSWWLILLLPASILGAGLLPSLMSVVAVRLAIIQSEKSSGWKAAFLMLLGVLFTACMAVLSAYAVYETKKINAARLGMPLNAEMLNIQITCGALGTMMMAFWVILYSLLHVLGLAARAVHLQVEALGRSRWFVDDPLRWLAFATLATGLLAIVVWTVVGAPAPTQAMD